MCKNKTFSMNECIYMLNEHRIPYESNVSLKKKTWIHRGGICLLWIEPLTIEQMKVIVGYFHSKNIHFEIVGHTSNLYFLNGYNPNVVVSTRKLKSYNDSVDGYIVCECGVNMKSLARYCLDQGYEGYEGLIDLPGTVGAAVYNNAGCYNCSVSDLLLRIEYLDTNDNVCFLTKEDLKFSNRSSILKRENIKNKKIILFVYLEKRKRADKTVLKQIAIANAAHRRMYQERAYSNLGSTYAQISYKLIPLLLIKSLSLICRLCNKQRDLMKYIKKMLLIVYGYKQLDIYISDYSIHCFIWRNEDADDYFIEYTKFINRISTANSLEVEIKDGF